MQYIRNDWIEIPVYDAVNVYLSKGGWAHFLWNSTTSKEQLGRGTSASEKETKTLVLTTHATIVLWSEYK